MKTQLLLPGQIWKSNIYGGRREIVAITPTGFVYRIDGIEVERTSEWFKKWMAHELVGLAAQWPKGLGV